MLLKTVFVRFYKSFNFDYLRKFHDSSKPEPWELLGADLWYPHVRVPVDRLITTIVGANESGKSHLLTAIEKGITGNGIEREDFCRYSEFHSVELGKREWPDFGFEWNNLGETECQVVQEACGVSTSFSRFFLFRTNRETLTVYIPTEKGGFDKHEVRSPEKIAAILPRLFRIASDVALPESVPSSYLTGNSSGGDRFSAMQRRDRFDFLEQVGGVLNHTEWFSNVESVKQQAGPIAAAMSVFLAPSGSQSQRDGTRRKAEVELARKLIFQVAGIDPSAIEDLQRALKEGKDGHANGLIQKVNDHLAASLNFQRWWKQDKDFRLEVTSRDHDLVFTIRDRTGTEYSFQERSDGLKYFLSYYIQYRAHEPAKDRSEILLMDEPDTYLSAQAQQDLLRIFGAIAEPEDAAKPIQVVYVTHSPFLIDRNHSERIRVLDKGVGDEGTRVVKDASRNHYEPLRSAFGAFVGEMTFIGNCNLMVEGSGDQILLAGAATGLRSNGAGSLDTLDLNHLTIVPAGSASQVPYLVYLAKGRDVEQPALITLLDSDEAGNEAVKRLAKGGVYGRQLLRREYILQLADLKSENGFPTPAGSLVEIEDLVPPPLALAAVQRYIKEICGAGDDVATRFTTDAFSDALSKSSSLFEAIEAALTALGQDLHITKIGFARALVEVVAELRRVTTTNPDLMAPLQIYDSRMKILFRRLNAMSRSAEREQSNDRVSQRVDRAKKSFLQDHPSSASREQAHVLFEDMLAALDPDSLESDSVRLAIQQARREHSIEVNMTDPVEDFPKFRETLQSIRYASKQATQDKDTAHTPGTLEAAGTTGD